MSCDAASVSSMPREGLPAGERKAGEEKGHYFSCFGALFSTEGRRHKLTGHVNVTPTASLHGGGKGA